MNRVTEEQLLRLVSVRKYYPVRQGSRLRSPTVVRAVDDVSLGIDRGETLALVGESGCGKTTLGRLALRLLPLSGGRITFLGRDIGEMKAADLRAFRRQAQIVFQDPYSSLNPRLTVRQIVAEAPAAHGIASGGALHRLVNETLEKVGLSPDYAERYPHEFSGGQRQRIGIARALALNPKLIVCDEAVSALDVSIQAQIINLLKDLQAEYGIAYLFISHDLNVVRYLADRVAVMYLGKLVEIGRADDIMQRPSHPYTQALISANPVPDPDIPWVPAKLTGEPPSALKPLPGCPFHPRCARADPGCAAALPPQKGTAEHPVWCHLAL